MFKPLLNFFIFYWEVNIKNTIIDVNYNKKVMQEYTGKIKGDFYKKLFNYISNQKLRNQIKALYMFEGALIKLKVFLSEVEEGR